MSALWTQVIATVVGGIILAAVSFAFGWIKAKAQFTTTSSTIRIFTRENRPTNSGETEKLIQRARKEVVVTGSTLEKMLDPNPDLEKLIRRKLENNCTFRLLMASPQNPHLETFNHYLGTDQSYQLLHERTKKCISVFRSRAPKYNVNGDCFTLRLETKTMLPYRLIIIDKDEPDAICRVEMYFVNDDSANRPTFILSRKNNREMFDMFCRQFENVWNRAEDV